MSPEYLRYGLSYDQMIKIIYEDCPNFTKDAIKARYPNLDKFELGSLLGIWTRKHELNQTVEDIREENSPKNLQAGLDKILQQAAANEKKTINVLKKKVGLLRRKR
jgi:hypothetical protein